jgi:C-terminal processing protease CtpA/Prc
MLSRPLSVALIIGCVLPPFAQAQQGEQRFDPPHRGAYLGVQIDPKGDAPKIDQVLTGGAAETAGLQRGDIIERFGEWSADAEETLPEFLANAIPQTTPAIIEREGETLELDIDPDSLLAATARNIAQKLTRHRLFRNVKRGDLGSLESDLVAAVRKTKTREAAYRAMNDVIDRFDLSHTAIITPWVSANMFGAGEHFHLGMLIQEIDYEGEPRYFARALMHGSPARSAGLLVGDEIVAINGEPYGRSPRRTLAGFEARHRMDAVQIDAGERVEIHYRRHDGGALKSLKITADRAIDAVASAHASTRILRGPGEAAVGYVHFWNVMSKGNTEVLEDALSDEFKTAKALAIDLRGRGGRVDVIGSLSRILSREKRPVALLIDRQARSAKEMLAHRLKGRSHITLVGETTAGAVLPAGFTDLPGGAQLMAPISTGDLSIRFFNRGQKLEGRGAIPDVEVDSPIPYAAGQDVILERALALLRKQAAGELIKL